MRQATLLLTTAALAFASCSDDSSTTAPATTAPTTTIEATTTTAGDEPVADGSCPNLSAGSSPAEFDGAEGTYAVLVVGFDDEPAELEFDVIQYLSGEDAKAVWLEDHPDEPDGPPNDFYTVNESDQVRTAAVRSSAAVHLTHLQADGTAAVEADDLANLSDYLADPVATSNVYWLTFFDGDVTELCEQYSP